MALQNLVDQGSSLSRLQDDIQTHHTWRNSFERVIIPTQRCLSDKIKRSHETGDHDPGGIGNCNPSKRGGALPRIRSRAHRDRQSQRHSLMSYINRMFVTFHIIFYKG